MNIEHDQSCRLVRLETLSVANSSAALGSKAKEPARKRQLERKGKIGNKQRRSRDMLMIIQKDCFKMGCEYKGWRMFNYIFIGKFIIFQSGEIDGASK